MHSFTQAVTQWALPGIILVSALGALVMSLLVFRYGFPSAEPGRRSSGDAVLITRMGHAIAGAFFAIAALLAVVVLAQPARQASPLEPSALPDVVARDEVDALRRALADTEAQLARVDSRLSAAGAEADVGRRRVEDLEARVVATESSLHGLSEQTARALTETKRLSAAPPPRPAAAVSPSRPPAKARPVPVAEPSVVPPSPAPARPAPRPLEVARPTANPASPSRPLERAPDPSPPAPRTVAPEPHSAAPRSGPDSEPDLGTRLREDWELVKREGRRAGDQVRDVFRRLRDALDR